MVRTQIYLTTHQMRLLRKAARRNRVSMSEQIRRLIEVSLPHSTSTTAAKPGTGLGTRMLAIASKAKAKGWSGPADLSRRVDHYLYGKDA